MLSERGRSSVTVRGCVLIGKPITIWKPGTGKRPYLSLAHLRQIVHNIIRLHPANGIYNAVTQHWNPLEIATEIQVHIPDLHIEYVTPRILNQDAYLLSTYKTVNAGLYRVDDSEALASLQYYIYYMVNSVLKGVRPT
jgi:hypothetical protein